VNPSIRPEDATCQRCGFSLTGLDRRGHCPECGQHFDRDKIATFDTSRTKAGDKLAVASIAVSIVCLVGLIPTFIRVAGGWSAGAGNTLAWGLYLAVFGAAFLATCLAHAARKRLPFATRSTYRQVAKLGLVIGYFCMGLLCVLWVLAILFSRG